MSKEKRQFHVYPELSIINPFRCFRQSHPVQIHGDELVVPYKVKHPSEGG